MNVILKLLGFGAAFSSSAFGSTSCSSSPLHYPYNLPVTWSSWGRCDQSCAGGTQTRSGSCYYMYYKWLEWHTQTVYDSRPCNQFCYHGSFVSNACHCQQGAKGRCCEILPVCQPMCENGGKCFEDGMCQCQAGFYGQWCEIGSDYDAALKPQLRTRVPLGDTDKPNSWYDVPETSDFARACYVKVHTQGAAHDMLIEAESAVSGDALVVFGNYSAAPVDNQGSLNGTSRFSCLEVRCPGLTSGGAKVDVSVNVTLTSRYKACILKKHAPGLSDFRRHTSSSGFSFTMQEGHNYGSGYGIYIGMGYRDKANYIAKHSCFSGHRFDLTHINPAVGILAEYTCA